MTTMSAASAPASRRFPRIGLSPDRDDVTDGVFLLVLTAIGLVGFRNAYGGHTYLVAGVVGVAFGVALGHVSLRARLPLLSVTALTVALFLLLGGLFARNGVSALPTVHTLHDVVTVAVHGWKQLLTTGRPVGAAAHLLVLPYLLGLAAGVGGHGLARRTRRVMLPALAPATVVALSILFGSNRAAAAALQGAVFAAITLAWASVRQRRLSGGETTLGRQRPWQRLFAAAAVLAVAGAGATVVGPRLPFADSGHRVVLRAVPPFDPAAYPSPLASYRLYTKAAPPAASRYDRELFTTTGLPDGSALRIAAMDSYDGVVWGVANAAAGSSSFSGFQRVGGTLPDSPSGRTHTASITVTPSSAGPWLPDVAGTTALGFTGATGHAVASSLRFNVATSTGVVPGGVPPVTYTVRYVPQPSLSLTQIAAATPYGEPTLPVGTYAFLQGFANAHGGDAGSPTARVAALATYLRLNGRFSDGDGGQTDILPGHSIGRLSQFLLGQQIVGDGEQYAAAMALLANAVGVPARVVLDGIVKGNTVHGRDVKADVELHLAQSGWVTLPASAFTGTQQPTPEVKKVPPPTSARVVPPPATQAVPATAEDNNQQNSVSRKAPPRPHASGVFHIPAFVGAVARDVGAPLLVLALAGGVLAGVKLARRSRRRSSGSHAMRVAAAWREILDFGRDLGIRHDARATRREQGAHVEQQGVGGASALAVAADAAIFGADHPDDMAVDDVWRLVEQTRSAAIGPLPRWRRVWVAVNPVSLWSGRAQLLVEVRAATQRRTPLRRVFGRAGGAA